jgi:hypothetical protein
MVRKQRRQDLHVGLAVLFPEYLYLSTHVLDEHTPITYVVSKHLYFSKGVRMKHKWFREWGWLYYPISWQGLILVLLVLAFWIQVFLAIDHRSHSVSDTLYGIFPYFVPSFLLLLWIASKTSQRD